MFLSMPAMFLSIMGYDYVHGPSRLLTLNLPCWQYGSAYNTANYTEMATGIFAELTAITGVAAVILDTEPEPVERVIAGIAALIGALAMYVSWSDMADVQAQCH